MATETQTPYIGSRVKRVEDPRLLTGNGRYVDDIKLAGTLHVAFVRSDQAHARILSVDYADALELPGVVAVYSGEDLRELAHPIVADSNMANYHATPMHALAVGKVRFVGEPVVAIVAESR